MSPPRPIAYKQLKVHHTGAADVQNPNTPERSGKALDFAALLRKRPATPATARPMPPARPSAMPSAVTSHTATLTAELAAELGSRMAQAIATLARGSGPGEAGADNTAQDGTDSTDGKDAPESADAPDGIRRTPLEPRHAAAPVHGALAVPGTPQYQVELVRYLADTVARFCSDPAVAHGEGWQVRLSLDPAVLPDTTLHLNLSPSWLLLRFESDDARSRALVSNHQAVLEQALAKTLVPCRDIAISSEPATP
jgi:type III secretion control protein HpaP